MSTLSEIESAVKSLPVPQQRTLLVWLHSQVREDKTASSEEQARREAWLQKLAERRQRGITGKMGTPLQQILDELR